MPNSSQKDVQKASNGTENSHVKDITNKTDLSRYLDNNLLRTNPFGHNLSAEQVYKRAERISAAIYLLTGHIEQEEPLRLSVRSDAVNLLHLSMSVKHSLRSDVSEHVLRLQSLIRTLISLTRMLGVSGYVSFQNTQTLVEALDDLGALLVSAQKSPLSEHLSLSREDLVPITTRERERIAPRRSTTTSRTVGAFPDVKDGGKREEVHTQRTDRILDILKSGAPMGIKDVVSNLPEYSEKMVQRGLAELVTANKIQKIGEKRWSRYQLTR